MKRKQNKNTIDSIDNNLYDYEINMHMHEKEYQSLVNYKSNLQRISLVFYFGSSDKRKEIDINNNNDDIKIENEFENGNMESKPYPKTANNN